MSFNLRKEQDALRRQFRGGHITAPEYMAKLEELQQDYRAERQRARQDEDGYEPQEEDE